MTWFLEDDGYQLFFNRDERNSRHRAELPETVTDLVNGLSYVAPTDADAGGTWISVNECGVTVCLLNHYQFEQPEAYQNWTSRGEIVRSFAYTQTVEQAEVLFLKMNLVEFRAFRLFIIFPDGENRLFIWDGHQHRLEANVATPKSSSSVDARHVKATRKEYFQELNLLGSKTAKNFIDYHSSHYPQKSKASVCMHREDGNTVSLSHIVVTHADVDFYYADGSPCKAALSKVSSVQRKWLPVGNSLAELELSCVNRLKLVK